MDLIESSDSKLKPRSTVLWFRLSDRSTDFLLPNVEGKNKDFCIMIDNRKEFRMNGKVIYLFECLADFFFAVKLHL